MTQELFMIYDNKAKQYVGQIIMARTSGVAIRAFQDMIKADNILGQHAPDFELYNLGAIELDDGLIIGRKPEHVVDATPLIQPDIKLEA